MTDVVWPSLVIGTGAAIGFTLYMRLVRRADMRASVPQILIVGALAAVIAFVLRVLF